MASQSQGMTEPLNGSSPAAASHRRWIVLGVLFLVYFSSSMDRMIVSIAGEPIKNELLLSDWELGLLNGFAFTVLYIGLGIPLARLADRGNRRAIITACLVVWSAMTAMCGVVGNFAQLVLCRMGVGVGESGCLPTSHSLISDYFGDAQRTTALALFGLGLPLGGLGGMIFGGLIVDHFGWREAFLALGVPGVFLAGVVWLIVREPERRFEGGPAEAGQARANASLGDILRFLLRDPVSRNVLSGATLATMFTSPTITFLAPYMARNFSVSYSEIGLMLGIAQMGGIALSTFFGGVTSDLLGKRDRRWYVWVPVLSLVLGGPLFALAFAQQSVTSFIVMLFFAAVAGAAYLPPTYAVLYMRVQADWRATTAATAGVLMNLIGLSVGPIACGLLMDALTSYNIGQAGFAELAQACVQGGGASIADSTSAAICNSANVAATRTSLIMFSLGVLWPAVHFWRAGQTLRE